MRIPRRFRKSGAFSHLGEQDFVRPAAETPPIHPVGYWQVYPKPGTHGRAQGGLFCPRRPRPNLYRKRAPKGSNLGVFGKGKRVLHVDPEIAHRILDLAVAEKDLDSP